MAAARKEEISMQVQRQESESKRHREFLELIPQQQKQQHQQMHSVRAMLLQQQEQQSQLMMVLLSKLQDKSGPCKSHWLFCNLLFLENNFPKIVFK